MARLQRRLSSFYRAEIDGANRLLGILKFYYLGSLLGIVLWGLDQRGEATFASGFYTLFMAGVMLHGLFFTRHQALLTRLAAIAQTLRVVRLLWIGSSMWMWSAVWMGLLWAGASAAAQVERLLGKYPELAAEARRGPWRVFVKLVAVMFAMAAIPWVLILLLSLLA